MEYVLKKVKFSESRFGKAISGKGFYIALCLSLIAVGVAGVIAYNQTVKKISEPPVVTSPVLPSENEEETSEIDVAKPEQDIPKSDEQTTNVVPMVMPVTGEILNPFSNGELVKSTTTNVWSTHNGVDIAAEIGTQVKCMTNGTVTDVGNDPLWGNYVIIDHGNGIESKYCNLNSVLTVKKDDEVSAGTVIGSVSDSAKIELADPSHLHFEVKRNGEYIDPITYIDPSSK